MIIVLFGAPGAGKGTVAESLSKRFGIPHVSEGDLLREEIGEDTPLGQKIKEFIDDGFLAPDNVAIEILSERISQKDCAKGFVLDGFPRTLVQAKELESMLKKTGQSVSFVFNIVVPEEVIIARLSSRLICPKCHAVYNLNFKKPKKQGVCDVCGSKLVQRPDDKPDVIKVRLKEYEKRTRPVIGFYEKEKSLKNIEGIEGNLLLEKIVAAIS